MIVQFYNNSSENIRVDKTDYITLLYTYDCLLKQSTSILTPTLILNILSGVVSYNDIPIVDDSNNIVTYGVNIFNCSYVYIPQFNRYYYINNITSINNNIWSIDLNVDVLMSYKDEILKLNGMISRNEFNYNDYLVDSLNTYSYDINIVEYIPDNISSDITITDINLSDFNALTPSYVINVINNQTPSTTITNVNAPVSTLNNLSTYNIPNGFDRRYIMSYGNIIELSGAILSYLSDYSVFIKSVVLYPFALPYNGNEPIVLGDKQTDINGLLPSPNFSPYFNIAHINIEPKYNDYRDLEPYSVYEIWLPFYGWYKLDANKYLGIDLLITYVMNYDNGSAQIFLNDTTNLRLLDTLQVQVGIQVGVNQTNTQEVERNKRAQSLNVISGSVASFVPLGVGVATGNLLAVGVGAYSLYKTIVSNNIAQENNVLTGSGRLSDSQVGLYGSSKVRLRISRKKWLLSSTKDLEKFSSLYGKPLYKPLYLYQLKGFTMIDTIHIDNITATSNEKNEIETLLKNGIIL